MNDFKSCDEWLLALQAYGESLGAKPPGILGIGILGASKEVLDFWDEIIEVGELEAVEGNPTIEEQLRKVWASDESKS